MAQHDYVIANQSGSAFRADLNNALSATVTGNSGSSAPSTTYAYMIWNDTTSNQRKIRNSANNAWIVLSTLSGGNVFDDDVTFNGASYNLVWDKSDNALEFADNAKCTFGDSDLSIYHDGSNSHIKDITDYLFIYGNNGVVIQTNSSGTAENQIRCINNGAVELYYDGVKKLETLSGGVLISGDLQLQGADGGTDWVKWSKTDYILTIKNGANLEFGNSRDIQIFHDGTDSNLYNNTGNLLIYCANDFYLKHGAEKMIAALDDGAVELYYDGVKKLETQTYGLSTNITNALRWIEDSNSSSRSWQLIGEDGAYGQFELLCNDSDGGTIDKTAIKAISGGTVELYYDGTRTFATASNNNFHYRHCDPYAADTLNLGHSYRWKQLYANNATSVGSDRTTKNTILDSDLGLSFINQLRPVSFKKNNQGDSIHYGLIAQEVEDVIKNTGKSLEEFAAIDKPTDKTMGLSYSEFISPLIKAVQELSDKVAALEAK